MISFDVFDTLVTRSTKHPKGIFSIMQEILAEKSIYYGVDKEFAEDFYFQRVGAEQLARKKWCVKGIEDITLEQIYNAMVFAGGLSEEAAEKILTLELQVEEDNILPIKENINLLKEYRNKGERVVLISDMYLSEEQIRKLLVKADSVFEDMTIYVSSEYKMTKTSGHLYQEIAKKEKVSFEDWTHYGDNSLSDVERPVSLGICAVKILRKEPLDHEKRLLAQYADDAFVQSVVGVSSYLNGTNDSRKVGHSYGGPIIYSYVSWLLHVSLKQGIKRLYFVARDGWILKQTADIIILERGLDLQTHYIYGSRKAWRTAAISEDKADLFNLLFNAGKNIWQSAKDIEDLLQVSKEELAEWLPDIYKTILFSETKYFSRYAGELLEYINGSDRIKTQLKEKYNVARELVEEYLKENVDLSDNKFAFVELSGTGYTQICLTKVIQRIRPCKVKSFFLQMAGIWEEENAEFQVYHPNVIPYHYIVEMLCRAPHGQTEGYRQENGKIVPVLDEKEEEWKSGSGYSEYIEGVLDFVRVFEGIQKKNRIRDNGKVVDSYLHYVNDVHTSVIHDFLCNMSFSTCGVEYGQTYAPPLTKQQLKIRFLYNEIPLDYKGASIDFALSHMSVEDTRVRDYYCKLRRTLYGKWCLRRYYNKNYKLYGSQRYFYPKGFLQGNILLYGAGKVGKDYYKQLKKDKKCNLIAWTDTNYVSMEESLKRKLISPDKMKEYQYDYILVAIASRDTYEKIRDSLIKRGVMKDKVIWIAPIVKR